MEEKVFCKKCLHYSDESRLALYSEIDFRDSKKEISYGTPICTHDMKTDETVVINPIETHIDKKYTVNNPYILNKGNNCPYFEKWRFWSL